MAYSWARLITNKIWYCIVTLHEEWSVQSTHCNFSYMKIWIQVGMHQVHLEGWNQMKITLIKLSKTNDKKRSNSCTWCCCPDLVSSLGSSLNVPSPSSFPVISQTYRDQYSNSKLNHTTKYCLIIDPQVQFPTNCKFQSKSSRK